MYKKLVLVGAVLTMLLGVAGCSSTNKDNEKVKATLSSVNSANFTIIENYEDADGKHSTQLSISELTKPNHQIGIVEKDLSSKDSVQKQYYYLSDDSGAYTEYKNDSGKWSEDVVKGKDVPTYINILENDSELYKNIEEKHELGKDAVIYKDEKNIKVSSVKGLADLIKQRLDVDVDVNKKVPVLIGVKKKEIARMTFELGDLGGKKDVKYQVLVSDKNKLTELELPSEALNKSVDVRKTSDGLKISNSKVLGTDWTDFEVYVNGDTWTLGDYDISTVVGKTGDWVEFKKGFSVKTNKKGICYGVRVTKNNKYSVILPSDISISSSKDDVESAYGVSKDYKYKSDNGYLTISFDNGNKVSEIEYVRTE